MTEKQKTESLIEMLDQMSKRQLRNYNQTLKMKRNIIRKFKNENQNKEINSEQRI